MKRGDEYAFFPLERGLALAPLLLAFHLDSYPMWIWGIVSLNNKIIGGLPCEWKYWKTLCTESPRSGVLFKCPSVIRLTIVLGFLKAQTTVSRYVVSCSSLSWGTRAVGPSGAQLCCVTGYHSVKALTISWGASNPSLDRDDVLCCSIWASATYLPSLASLYIYIITSLLHKVSSMVHLKYGRVRFPEIFLKSIQECTSHCLDAKHIRPPAASVPNAIDYIIPLVWHIDILCSSEVSLVDALECDLWSLPSCQVMLTDQWSLSGLTCLDLYSASSPRLLFIEHAFNVQVVVYAIYFNELISSRFIDRMLSNALKAAAWVM